MLEDIEAETRLLDVLCVESSITCGPNGTGRYHVLSGTGRPMLDWVQSLAHSASHVLAVGTCAAYGGIPTAGENPTDSVGLQYDGLQKGGALGGAFISRSGLPVINVAGCPTYPDWVTETLLMLVADALTADDLDSFARPRFYADHLVHHACPKNEFTNTRPAHPGYRRSP